MVRIVLPLLASYEFTNIDLLFSTHTNDFNVHEIISPMQTKYNKYFKEFFFFISSLV